MNTDYREIRDLLNKYWEGESTLEEEKKIKSFFHTHLDPLPDDLEQVRGLFGFYESESLGSAGNIRLPKADQLKKYAFKDRIRFLKHYWEYAAIFLFVITNVVLFRPSHYRVSPTVDVKDTYENPEQAFAATQKALELLAANLNRGKDQMQKLAIMDQTEKIVNGKK